MPMYGTHFSCDRKMSPLAVTAAPSCGAIMWGAMAAKTCARYKELLQPSAFQIGNSLLGPLSSKMGSTKVMGMDISIGPIPGPVVGCTAWQPCKDHAASRSLEYQTLQY